MGEMTKIHTLQSDPMGLICLQTLWSRNVGRRIPNDAHGQKQQSLKFFISLVPTCSTCPVLLSAFHACPVAPRNAEDRAGSGKFTVSPTLPPHWWKDITASMRGGPCYQDLHVKSITLIYIYIYMVSSDSGTVGDNEIELPTTVTTLVTLGSEKIRSAL